MNLIKINRIRTKLLIAFSGLVLLLLAILLALNSFFLDDFFIRENKENMVRVTNQNYNRIQSIQSKDEYWKLISELKKMTGGEAIILDTRIFLSGQPPSGDYFDKNPELKTKVFMNTLMDDDKTDSFSILKTDMKHDQKLVFTRFIDDHNALIICKGMGLINEAKVTFLKFLSFASIIVYIIGCGLIYFLSRHLSKPVIDLKNSAEKISNLDFSAPLPENLNDEIGDLTISINKMSSELQNAIKALKYSNGQLSRELSKEKNLEKMRRRFVSDVSHELKNPINMVLNYAEGLKRGLPKTEEARQTYIDVILEEGKRMNHLTRDLLDLSSYESGAYTLKIDTIDIGEVTQSTLERFELQRKEKQVTVYTDILPNIELEVDGLRISQVLINLFSNAFKHVESGGKIHVSVHSNGPKTIIQISNSGPLIPINELDNIWNSFYQIGTDTEGNGLGLTIVKRIVELHEGHVYAFVEKGMNHFCVEL